MPSGRSLEAPPKSRGKGRRGAWGRSKRHRPARHVLASRQWPSPSPPWERGGAPSWRHQDNGRCRCLVTSGCGRARRSSAMVSLGPQWVGPPALPRPGRTPARPLLGSRGRRRGRGEAGLRPAGLRGRAGLGGPGGGGARGDPERPPAPGRRQRSLLCVEGLGLRWDPHPVGRRTA